MANPVLRVDLLEAKRLAERTRRGRRVELRITAAGVALRRRAHRPAPGMQRMIGASRPFDLTRHRAARYGAGMIWIAYVAGGLAGLVALMALIGLLLPREHVAARRAVLPAPPDAVWTALVDLDAQPRWRRGLQKLERLDDRRFRETSRDGTITFEVVEERPPELRITRIADDKLPFGGRWIYELAPDGAGTRLTITEDGFIKNPVFRFLARTVYSTSATMEAFLRDLASHLGVAPTPAAVEPAEPSPRATRHT